MNSMTAGKTIGAGFLFLLGGIAAAADAQYVVTAPVADMHRAASLDSDVVSQAIFSSPIVPIELSEGWLKGQTADGYVGWMQLDDLAPQEPDRMYGTAKRVASVESLFANLYREADIEKHRPVLTVPFESRLEITGEKPTPDGLFYSVRLPDDSIAWVQEGDVTFDRKQLSIPQSIMLAKRFLGLPYRWGGTSSLGYDCSGFTQMLMRSRGILMPRDSSVQAKWDGFVAVDRRNLKAGDVLFFGRTPEKINHTGMYIGNGEFIHATRFDQPVVQIDKLGDSHWNSRFICARRAK